MDECRNSPCGDGAECTNVPGGFKCACAAGFVEQPASNASTLAALDSASPTGQRALSCVDVNECETVKNACGANAECVNTQGNYFCQCLANFSGNAKTGCSDIDECATLASACGPNALCNNSPGSYQCACKPGFAGKFLVRLRAKIDALSEAPF